MPDAAAVPVVMWRRQPQHMHIGPSPDQHSCVACLRPFDGNPWKRVCPGHGWCHIACMVSCSRSPGCGRWFCRSHEEDHICVVGLPQMAVTSEASDLPYLVHYTAKTRFTRLHKRGGCHRRPGRELKEVTWHATLSEAPYMAWCSDCWPSGVPAASAGSNEAEFGPEQGDSSSSSESS